ncbi:hypothetical protein ACWA5Z_10930 [Testudinibacter sp. P80/BLE/0925]|uniref:hypothetical protein n=1 Tax=Testudinibacter sp. TW-1 TaxID=3417757 RepID=UPI003D36332E
MPVNFTKIFQDSLNFLINQKPLLITVMALFVINNLATQLILSSLQPPIAVLNDAEYRINGTSLMLTIAAHIISLLLVLWLLNLIIQISKGQAANFATALNLSLGKIIPFVVLNIISVLPISLGITSFSAPNVGIIALLSFCVGGYLFLRLFLAQFAYIIENGTIGEALKLVWLNSGKRVFPLFLLVLATYILPLLVSLQLANLGNSLFVIFLSSIITAAISIFTVVFTYRFYQLFIDKNILRKFQ